MSHSSTSDDARLTVGDLAARTGVAAGTLRMWEQRHGFPVPVRLPSGHRRYRERDVIAVARVLAARDRGVRLEKAVADAHTLDRVGDSVYSLLRARHPDLAPQRMRKRTLQSLTHAIEDEFCSTVDRSRILAGFQTTAFFAPALPRWRSVAQVAGEAVIFAVDAGVEIDDSSVRVVYLTADAPTRREWFLVCESCTLPVVMAAWELPDSGPGRRRDADRLFEVMWSLDPAVVSDAVVACGEIAARAGQAIPGPDPALAATPASNSAALFLRAMSYVDAQLVRSSRPRPARRRPGGRRPGSGSDSASVAPEAVPRRGESPRPSTRRSSGSERDVDGPAAVGAQSRADAVVLFGVTGDLVYKKLIPALYHLGHRDRLGVPVIGVARSDWSDEQLVARARGAVEEAVERVDADALDRLTGSLTMVTGEYADPATYERLAQCLRSSHRPVFYLAIPPAVFDDVVDGLAAVGLAERGRVIVEKPFGRDRSSAAELNATLARAFAQDDIFRIDHYLGKESVEGLLVFRFANAFLEPVWNRNYISSVQVTLAEEFGTQGRAGFYDGVGAVRDVLQNHLLQVVALLAMEPPIAEHADAYRDEEVRLLRQVRELDPATTVRGQYVGYLDEDGVDPGSTTETFVATQLSIESWRWAGVPFTLRTGKKMPGTATEAVVELRRPPRLLFASEASALPEANRLHFRLGHDDGVTMSVQAKSPGARTLSQPVDLGVDFAAALGHRQEAYERLLDDAMDGRRHRFAREDTIDEEWRIVTPLLDVPDRPVPYYRGTWGPEQAHDLVGDWHDVSLRQSRPG